MGILKNLFGKKEPVEHPLRAMALKATAQDLEVSPTAETPKVFGMIMEQAIPMLGSAMFVAFADGSVSMYWGARGGIIGAGQHDNVRLAAEEWLSVGQATFDQGQPVPGLDTAGNIKFIWKGFDGDRHASADAKELMSTIHPLHVLFAASQNVVTQIRLADQARKS